jgi:hypothetical protein
MGETMMSDYQPPKRTGSLYCTTEYEDTTVVLMRDDEKGISGRIIGSLGQEVKLPLHLLREIHDFMLRFDEISGPPRNSGYRWF